MDGLYLTEDKINAIVEQIKTFMSSRKVANRDVMKLGLLIEELLLRFMEKFGREQIIFVDFSKFANTKISISLKGEQYNPILEDEDDIFRGSEFLKNLLNTDSTSVSYRYRNGYNEIVVLAREEHKSLKIPGGALTIAIILAFVAALLTRQSSASSRLSTFSYLLSNTSSPTCAIGFKHAYFILYLPFSERTYAFSSSNFFMKATSFSTPSIGIAL